MAEPTTWKPAPPPRLPRPAWASLFSKRQSVIVAVARLVRPPPNAVPMLPVPPVLVLLDPPRTRFPLKVLPLSDEDALVAIEDATAGGHADDLAAGVDVRSPLGQVALDGTVLDGHGGGVVEEGAGAGRVRCRRSRRRP